MVNQLDLLQYAKEELAHDEEDEVPAQHTVSLIVCAQFVRLGNLSHFHA
jgi:hypothetical protein